VLPRISLPAHGSSDAQATPLPRHQNGRDYRPVMHRPNAWPFLRKAQDTLPIALRETGWPAVTETMDQRRCDWIASYPRAKGRALVGGVMATTQANACPMDLPAY